MIHHGGSSPKRTMVVSNSRHVGKLNLGTLKLKKGGKAAKSTTTRRYIDKNGKARFVGTADLKRSQNLESNPGFFIFEGID